MILDTIEKFLEEPFLASINDTEYSKQWIMQGGKWI